MLGKTFDATDEQPDVLSLDEEPTQRHIFDGMLQVRRFLQRPFETGSHVPTNR